jgi:DNA-directed RNA polymerase specialized sigma subunit
MLKYQSKEKLSVKLIDMSYDMNLMIDQLVDLKAEINEKIGKLSKTEYTDVLFYRYIEAMSYKDISAEMELSCSYVYKLHERALKELESMLKDTNA